MTNLQRKTFKICLQIFIFNVLGPQEHILYLMNFLTFVSLCYAGIINIYSVQGFLERSV